MKNSKFEMVITDLDGTLLDTEFKVSDKNIRTLERLGLTDIYRVIATGRSFFSLKRVLPMDFPIDYLIFSSGAGTMEWKNKRIFNAYQLKKDKVINLARRLIDMKMDFMVQRPIPDNHLFVYHHAGGYNLDFLRRIRLYKGYVEPLHDDLDILYPASQFVVITDPDVQLYYKFKDDMKDFNVVRTTSPLDNQTMWIEFFPENVSKSHAAERLCKSINVDIKKVMAVGNDYNDLDLLEWASCPVVVANAPPEMKKKFGYAASNSKNGFSDAVEKKMSKL